MVRSVTKIDSLILDPLVFTLFYFCVEYNPLFNGSPCGKIGITASQASTSAVERSMFDCNLYLHWFGMKLYDLFHDYRDGDSSDIDIEIDNFSHSIPRQSLVDIVTAYQKISATHVGRGGTDREERSLTAQIATDLHEFLFRQHRVGKLLHQLPVYGRSERPDWLAIPVNDHNIPSVTKSTLICDFKPTDLSISRTESFAYCSRVLGNKYRTLISLTATCMSVEIYLIKSFNQKIGRTLICEAPVTDTIKMQRLFYVLYGAVHYLTRSPLETEFPTFSPFKNLEFNVDDLLSKNGQYRVFCRGELVYKLYDDSSSSKPNLAVLRLFSYFESLTLKDLNHTGRFKCLMYKYLDGDHESGNCLLFVPIAEILLKLHENGYVHGDVRLANIIFGTDTAWIIDFDICNRVNASYPEDYNHINIPERHREARANMPMKKEHDVYSLIELINAMHNVNVSGTLQEIISQLSLS